jgi:pyruvoyl-dependent arginine decarboxylase (PvlArgDC)
MSVKIYHVNSVEEAIKIIEDLDAPKEFPTGDVLSVIAGRNMTDMKGVVDIITHMVGEDISGMGVFHTIALPHAAKVLAEQDPRLAQVRKEAEEFMNDNNWSHWLEIWKVRLPPTIAIKPNSFGPDDC